MNIEFQRIDVGLGEDCEVLLGWRRGILCERDAIGGIRGAIDA